MRHDAVLAADNDAYWQRIGEAIVALVLLQACATPQEWLAHLKALGVSRRTPLSGAMRSYLFQAAALVWDDDSLPRTPRRPDWLPAVVRKLVQRCGRFSYAKLHAALAASDAAAKARRHASIKPEKVVAGLTEAMARAIAALETSDGAVASDLRAGLRTVLDKALAELQAPRETAPPAIPEPPVEQRPVTGKSQTAPGPGLAAPAS